MPWAGDHWRLPRLWLSGLRNHTLQKTSRALLPNEVFSEDSSPRTLCDPKSHPSSETHHIRCLTEHAWPSLPPTRSESRVTVSPSTAERLIPLTRSRTLIPSSRPSHPSTSAIYSTDTKRGIHSDVWLAPRLGRQTGADGRCKSDTTWKPVRHPAMTTPGTGPIPTGQDPRIDHRDSLSPPRDLPQTSRAASPTQGSTSSSYTAVHKLYDRVKPTADIKRYERSAKLEGPFIDVHLAPLTQSFADG